MFSESKVTELFCVADDFCKDFSLQEKKYMNTRKLDIVTSLII